MSVAEYDKIKSPSKRCENCINGAMYVNEHGDEWRDVYRCGLDGYLKDYRVTCDQWKVRQ